MLLASSVVDGLSVHCAGRSNVLAASGGDLTDADLQLLRELGVQELLVLGSEKGLCNRLKGIAGISFRPVTLPEGLSANAFLKAHGPEALGEALDTAIRPGGSAACTDGPRPDRQFPDGFAASFGPRSYEIRGLEKGPRKLRTTVRAEHSGRLHIDTLDLYSSRSRRLLCRDLSGLFEETPEVVDADIIRLLRLCEEHEPGTQEPVPRDAAARMAPNERREAEVLGRSPDLLERIARDYETCGLVGERANKLISYIAAVSRKMADPLSILVLSSSGAGKTALQSTTLLLCPPEDVVKLTSLTGRALFYRGRTSLQHKILAIEEGAGMGEATYAVRNLISARELVIETTVRDGGTGRLTTTENRVEGPTAVFITTTDPNTDPETASRFFILNVDESREQTRAILRHQRRQQTLDGRKLVMARRAVARLHHNLQRLLRPLSVVNPHAHELAYTDDRLTSRRDQPKHLGLMSAVAFLRQMTKDPKPLPGPGGGEYIEVDENDIRVAGELVCEVMGRTLDELNGVSRALLLQLEKLVESRLAGIPRTESGSAPARGAVTFTRREIREFTGWSHHRVKTYLRELVELEYVFTDSARFGSAYRYRLAYDGQGKDGEKFVLGSHAHQGGGTWREGGGGVARGWRSPERHPTR